MIRDYTIERSDGMIGYFGNFIFEVSDEKVYTFNAFKLDASARYNSHEIVGEKPKTEYSGPNLETISLTIALNGNYGLKPKDEMLKWIAMAESGAANYLFIGEQVLGQDQWIVKSVSETWDTFFNGGELFAGKIDVVFEEYISSATKGRNGK
jgi:Phage protein U